jgi:HD-like signal output (HDOD) protein
MEQQELATREMLVYGPASSDGPLHRTPDGWTVNSVDTVEAALAALSERSFDAIVSSGTEPGVDTMKVLVAARESRPDAIRILATANLGPGPTVALSSVAHHHLFTPVDSLALTDAVDRAARTRDNLARVRVQLLMKGRDLPSFPQIYMQITEELQAGTGDIDRIADIVRRDPGLIARVLQLVNSPFYGLRNTIPDVRQALGLLGIQNLLAMVLATEVFTAYEAGAAGLSVNRLWSHSAIVATWSKRIAEKAGMGREGANAAFVAGMLHDAGRLVLASSFPQQHSELLARVRAGEGELIESERSMLGASHDEAGALLLENWGLANELVEAVAFHHRPSESLSRSFSALTAVHVAEHFQSLLDGGGVEIEVPLDWAYLREVGITESQVEEWKLACDIF